MVVPESEISSKGEVNSPMQTEEPQKNSALALLGRQSSIYSLTLDEFQHTLIESGKHFGSMNMDEFLSSIWAAEENQAQAHGQVATATTAAAATTNNNVNNNLLFSGGEASTNRGISKQHSLSRQGSLTIPGPLCRKTVDEVWSEIHKGRHDRQQQQQQQQEQRQEQQRQSSSGCNNNSSSLRNQGSAQRQPTFGEMTLEDFLIKAGVVREQCAPALPTQQPPYGLYQNNSNPVVGPGPPGYVPRPVMGLGGGAAGPAPIPIYQGMPQPTVGGVGEPSGYARSGKRSGGGGGSGGYGPPPSTVCYSGVVGNGGGYGPVQGMGLGSPVSPVSSDGMGGSQMDGGNYGMEMGGMRGGRKRIIDGPVEKVVERRQRRMIKNRESAARSRARKQAYTVELEAELNQLKEENAQLKQALAEMERQRKQQYLEEAKKKTQTRAQKDKERFLAMRRNMSSPL